MAFATIEDSGGKIEVVIFPKIYAVTKPLWVKDQTIIVEGKLEMREDNLSLIVDNALPVNSDSENEQNFDFVIRIPKKIKPQSLMRINKLLKDNPGDKQGVLLFETNGDSIKPKKLILSFGVDYTPELREVIDELLHQS